MPRGSVQAQKADRRVTYLQKALASSRTVTALLEAAALARAQGDRRGELRNIGSARLQLFSLRAHLDQLEQAIEFGASPTRAGGGDATGGDAA